MNRILRLLATAGAGSLMLLGTALVSPASAAPQPTCGGVVKASVVLTGNLSCSGHHSGITLAAGVTVDCKKFAILGDPSAQGEGPGITVDKNSTVVNCTVKYFDAGILLQANGGNNLITINLIQDNISDGRGNFGDGIVVNTSSNNRITTNTVDHNGAFDGIGLIGKSNGNLIQFNSVTNNNLPSRTPSGVPFVNQDDGIRIEGPGAMNNQVLSNTVSGSGLEGIAVFGNRGTGFNNTGTVINGNSVIGNGFNSLNRQGSGIRLFLTGNNTQVTNNTSSNNAANGIEVDSLDNTITGNVATANSAAGSPPPRTGTAYDLLDTNPTCDANAWHANTFGTAHPDCAGTP